jgi:hypothetical protein
MAVIRLETLVLRGVHVVRDVVTALVRIGSKGNGVQAPAVSLSPTRHPSSSDPRTDTEPGKRYERAMNRGAAHAAIRAGRPGSCAGVLGSRLPARCAGRAILSGWARAAGGSCPTAAWRSGFTAGGFTAAGATLAGRPDAYPRGTLRHDQPRQLARSLRSDQRAGAELALPAPAHGTPVASTRGKRDVG